jgi:hypothetical protein
VNSVRAIPLLRPCRTTAEIYATGLLPARTSCTVYLVVSSASSALPGASQNLSSRAVHQSSIVPNLRPVLVILDISSVYHCEGLTPR